MAYRGNNYSFVVDSSFTPFTMQEMLQPLVAYKDAYEKAEETYAALSDKSDKFKYLSETLPEGSKARGIYEGYANELSKQADDLAKHGLNMGNRRALTSLKQRYQGEIGRLEQIDAIRRAQMEEQRKLYLQDPTRLFSRDASLTPFDDYLDNPNLSYKSYSGALLAQQVGSAASAIAKSLKDYKKGIPLDGFTKTWLQEHGYSADEVARAINDPASDKTGILSSIVNQAVASSGIPEWGDTDTINQAYRYARQGLWNAVGQTQVGTYTDEAAKLTAQEASQKRVARYAAEQQGLQQRVTQHAMLIPRALRSQQELEDNTKKINGFVKDGYMKEVDGKYVLTEKGKREYMKTISRSGVTYDSNAQEGAPGKQTTWTEYTPFRKYMDSLNGGKAIVNDKKQIMPTVMGNLFTKAVSNNQSGAYDMYHSTEYVRQLDDSYAKEVKRQVMSEGEVLQSLDFNGKDGFKGKDIKKKDMQDFTPTRINYSRYGATITWVNDKGESIRTNAPVAVNERVDSTVKQAMNNAALNAAILRTGKVPLFDANDNPVIKNGVLQFTDVPLTREAAQAYYNDWQEEMDIVNSIGSMYVSPSTTDDIKYKPYEFGYGMQGMYSSEEE